MAEDKEVKIVEVYVTADSFEAERLLQFLEEEGIQATVGGGEINRVAGSICVREQDQEDAARLIDQWLEENADGDDQADESDADESDADEHDDDETAPAEGISVLGKLLMLCGLGCIVWGASFAWCNYQLLQKCTGEAEANRFHPGIRIIPPLHPETNQPLPVDVPYEYQVNGQKYPAWLVKVSSPDDAPATVPVHYNPNNPREHLMGELPSIWLPLVFGGFFGLLIMFVVYRLN